MTKRRVMFMHTYNGRPASVRTGGLIGIVSGRQTVQLVPSRAQIHREQREDMRRTIDRGWEVDASMYGYVRVEVPE
jgi:hypothetical protein